MKNARLDEAQAGVKIAGKNINNLRYADGTTLMAEWALESITTNKANGGDGILVELFQILKDDGVKVLHSICQQICKTHQWPQNCKRPVFIPIPKKGHAKECSNYCTIALISHVAISSQQGRGEFIFKIHLFVEKPWSVLAINNSYHL